MYYSLLLSSVHVNSDVTRHGRHIREHRECCHGIESLIIFLQVQREYISAHESVMDSFSEALDRVWKSMCNPGTTSISAGLCILMAKEFTEWGRLLSCVAEASFLQGWALPTMGGGIILYLGSSTNRPALSVLICMQHRGQRWLSRICGPTGLM